jgi:hypothetical protein
MYDNRIIKRLCLEMIKKSFVNEELRIKILESSGTISNAWKFIKSIGFENRYSSYEKYLTEKKIRPIGEESDSGHNMVNIVIPPVSRFRYKIGKTRKTGINEIITDDYNFSGFKSVTGELLKNIIFNSLTDTGFKKDLIEKPESAIRTFVGNHDMQIPENIQFTVYEDVEDLYTIILRSMRNKNLYFGSDNY